MEQNKIAEGNRIIAEFDGWEYIGETKWGLFGLLGKRKPTYQLKKGFFEPMVNSDFFKYHTSWDWLMPVVKKSYSLCNDLQHPDEEEKLSIALLSCDIEELHETVVQFIEWRNTTKSDGAK